MFPAFDFQVHWRDLDANGHVGNSSYLDFATQARMFYLESQGFPPSDFKRNGIGPAVLVDHLEYRRELRHHDRFQVTVSLGGMNAARDRFIFAHRFLNGAGDICVTLRSMLVYFDLTARKKAKPTPVLQAAMEALPRDDAWEDL